MPRSRRSRPILAALVAAACLVPAPAAAQATPFDPDLLRLSEILGALAYLDRLCESPEAPAWRGRMQALIDAQQMNDDDRRRYVDVFNRGFRTFASIHRACTGRTRAVIDAYFDEGTRIAARLEDRFGRGAGATGLPPN